MLSKSNEILVSYSFFWFRCFPFSGRTTMTIDEISPEDREVKKGGWNKCREEDRIAACVVRAASRLTDVEYISIRSSFLFI